MCGRSRDQPWCDNSHVAEDWSCAAGADVHPLAFTAIGRIGNLARKLAAHHHAEHLRGESLGRADTPAVGRLVVLSDGSELLIDWDPLAAVRADSVVVVGLGTSRAALEAAYCGADVVLALERGPLPVAYRQIVEALQALEQRPQPTPPPRPSLKSIFVSHAVADEPLLGPVVQALRSKLGADVFVCGDSIAPGSAWQQQIYEALEARDVFVLVLSETALGSTFCAFEVGLATALRKPVIVVSNDGTRPPAYIQQLHAFDLPRARQTQPWLDEDDLLLEALLTAATG